MIKTGYEIATITAMDAVTPAVVDFFYANDADFYPPISQRMNMQEYIGVMIEKDGALIVVSDVDKIVGILGLTLTHAQFRYMIQYIAIDNSCRKQGIGHLLFSKAFDLFQQRGADRITIRTWSTNAHSQKLILKNGFTLFEKVVNDRGPGIHSLYFGKSLYTHYLEKDISRLGILGGMGPFSTGIFVHTLTGINIRRANDQDSLSFLLLNEAAIPDRTDSIHQNKVDEMMGMVNTSLEALLNNDVSHLILLCFTLHPFIGRMNIPGSVDLINLVDFVKTLTRNTGDRWMLAATLGTYKMKHFADTDMIIPSEPHRERIHEIITEIKTGTNPVYFKEELAGIAKEHQCTGIALGCTDLHRMFGYEKCFQGMYIFDPLLELCLLIEGRRKKD